MGIMDFACAWFMALWGVCDLDMPHLPNVRAQRCDEIPLHALHMGDFILILEIWTVDIVKQLQRLTHVREEVVRIFEDVEGLDHHTKTSGSGLISGTGNILAYPFHL